MKKKIAFWGMIASVAIIFALVAGLRQGRAFVIDEWISKFFSLVPESLDSFFRVITELGDKLGIGIVGTGMIIWLVFKRRDFLGAGILALGVALGNEANKILKELNGRERPNLDHLVEVNSLSFPSGHAMVGSILYLFIAYFLMKEYRGPAQRRTIAIVTGFIILLIGASRVILNVHYPTDVIGGYAFGFIWTVIWLLAYEGLRNKYPTLRSFRK